jgi:hypothetical protein
MRGWLWINVEGGVVIYFKVPFRLRGGPEQLNLSKELRITSRCLGERLRSRNLYNVGWNSKVALRRGASSSCESPNILALYKYVLRTSYCKSPVSWIRKGQEEVVWGEGWSGSSFPFNETVLYTCSIAQRLRSACGMWGNWLICLHSRKRNEPDSTKGIKTNLLSEFQGTALRRISKSSSAVMDQAIWRVQNQNKLNILFFERF